jgi:hypothetical protein
MFLKNFVHDVTADKSRIGMVDRLKLVKAPHPAKSHTFILSTEHRYMDRIIR